jgi:hypothetical protein
MWGYEMGFPRSALKVGLMGISNVFKFCLILVFLLRVLVGDLRYRYAFEFGKVCG